MGGMSGRGRGEEEGYERGGGGEGGRRRKYERGRMYTRYSGYLS